MCGSGSVPKAIIRGWAAPHIAKLKTAESKESTPPIQRSAPSSSGGPTSLGISRGSVSVRKRSVSSGRSASKSKRFSTTR